MKTGTGIVNVVIERTQASIHAHTQNLARAHALIQGTRYTALITAALFIVDDMV